MNIDGRQLPDGTVLEYDLCVVGAGAAGIAIARELTNSSTRVCLVESGGLEFEQSTQDLYQGRSVGLPYSLYGSRLRFFGGSTNHWEGNCSPFQPIDFEHLPWVPRSGWPFTRDHLDPYYRRAQVLCQLGPYEYDPRQYWGERAYAGLPVPPDAPVDCHLIRVSPPVRFGTAYRADLERAPNVDVCQHLNLMEAGLDPDGGRVERLLLASLDGRRVSIRSRRYVLACGGVENARLLLVSDSVIPAGVGNRYDHVGRFFMEHPRLPAGQVVTHGTSQLPPVFLSRRVGDTPVRGFLRLSAQQQRARQLIPCDISLTLSAASSDSWRGLLDKIRRGPPGMPSAQDVGEVAGHLDGAGAGGGSVPPLARGRRVVRDIHVTPGQSPNPDSRITLGEERDALGMRRVVLDWRFSALDKHSVAETVRALGEALGQQGSGRVQVADWLREDGLDLPPEHFVGNHHMGTTRMSLSPRDGVVDANCRVHGVDNLYLAGSSVFPNCGSANPTLTIVALALRLADHLAERAAADG